MLFSMIAYLGQIALRTNPKNHNLYQVGTDKGIYYPMIRKIPITYHHDGYLEDHTELYEVEIEGKKYLATMFEGHLFLGPKVEDE